MLQAYGHFKLVSSHLVFRFYRLACWWALSLGFCDSSNRSSTLEHKRTASLYRIALALWYPIGLPRRYLYRYLVLIDLLAHLVFGLIYLYYSPVARLMSFIGFSVPGTRYPLFCLCLFQIKTSFCLLGQWICQLYCSYIGLNSSSSCFSFFFWFVDSISPCAFTSPCLEIVPFLLPAQKSRSYSATRVDMFGSHGHIMNFSTCRARVIRWPVGRKQSNQLTYFPNQDSGATARLLNRLDLDHPELNKNLWLWRLRLSSDHDFKMPGSLFRAGSSLSIVHRM